MQEWVELWLASSIPVGFYFAAMVFSYKTAHIQASFPMWQWSWLGFKLACLGGIFVRMDALFLLWRAGMEGCHDTVNVEALIGAWTISFGLWLHAWLTWRWCKRSL